MDTDRAARPAVGLPVPGWRDEGERRTGLEMLRLPIFGWASTGASFSAGLFAISDTGSSSSPRSRKLSNTFVPPLSFFLSAGDFRGESKPAFFIPSTLVNSSIPHSSSPITSLPSPAARSTLARCPGVNSDVRSDINHANSCSSSTSNHILPSPSWCPSPLPASGTALSSSRKAIDAAVTLALAPCVLSMPFRTGGFAEGFGTSPKKRWISTRVEFGRGRKCCGFLARVEGAAERRRSERERECG